MTQLPTQSALEVLCSVNAGPAGDIRPATPRQSPEHRPRFDRAAHHPASNRVVMLVLAWWSPTTEESLP